jgi:putative oxidoreductase
MNAFPFISLPHALIVLRVSVAILYMAHATVRVVGGRVAQFRDFMERTGFSHGIVWVWPSRRTS